MKAQVKIFIIQKKNLFELVYFLFFYRFWLQKHKKSIFFLEAVPQLFKIFIFIFELLIKNTLSLFFISLELLFFYFRPLMHGNRYMKILVDKTLRLKKKNHKIIKSINKTGKKFIFQFRPKSSGNRTWSFK